MASARRFCRMLAAVASAAVIGIDAYHVLVEVDVAAGLPQWTIVGLPAGAVKESRERVSAALANSGFQLPPRRLTINLAPGDTRKEGTAFDLPIALGILVATGQLRTGATDGIVALGELGLDGALRPVRGVLPVARLLARGANGHTLVVPPPNVPEAGLVSSLRLSATPTPGSGRSWERTRKTGAARAAPPRSPRGRSTASSAASGCPLRPGRSPT